MQTSPIAAIFCQRIQSTPFSKLFHNPCLLSMARNKVLNTVPVACFPGSTAQGITAGSPPFVGPSPSGLTNNSGNRTIHSISYPTKCQAHSKHNKRVQVHIIKQYPIKLIRKGDQSPRDLIHRTTFFSFLNTVNITISIKMNIAFSQA